MKCCTSYRPMHNGFPRQHTFYGEKKHICYTSNNIQNPNGCWNLLQALGVRVTLKAAVTFGVESYYKHRSMAGNNRNQGRRNPKICSYPALT